MALVQRAHRRHEPDGLAQSLTRGAHFRCEFERLSSAELKGHEPETDGRDDSQDCQQREDDVVAIDHRNPRLEVAVERDGLGGQLDRCPVQCAGAQDLGEDFRVHRLKSSPGPGSCHRATSDA